VETPRYSGGKTHSKRLFDILASLALIVMLSPLLAATAIAVRLTSPGPALFRQPRTGKHGERFSMLKFRSMDMDAESRLRELRDRTDAGNDVLFKMKDDPRVTPLGRIIRRYSIDELPQLFNVLAGHMSLIGPRPPLPREVEEYGWQVHRRFLVKPGVTGLWQVSGRSNLSWEETVRLDLYYVENWTLTGDLFILFRTARAVLARDGAY
jgi:exopolysaccharide biosynthesis polyprenyl glycosylphosphotransferase